MHVAMIGTGYVGLVSAACFSEFGFNVTCVDKIAEKIDALKAGQIAGAALDVLDTEPATADEPLINDIDNLLVTPHNAWGAIESRNRLVMQMKENIEAFLIDQPTRQVL